MKWHGNVDSIGGDTSDTRSVQMQTVSRRQPRRRVDVRDPDFGAEGRLGESRGKTC